MNRELLFGLTIGAATIGIVLSAALVGWIIALAVTGLWDRVRERLRRRRIRRLVARAVAACLEHGGDALAAAIIVIGGLYAVGGGLIADALHAATHMQ